MNHYPENVSKFYQFAEVVVWYEMYEHVFLELTYK